MALKRNDEPEIDLDTGLPVGYEDPTEAIPDITPVTSPVGLARHMEKEAQAAKVVGGAAILVDEDGELWFDCCGISSATLVWALTKMISNLITGKHEPSG